MQVKRFDYIRHVKRSGLLVQEDYTLCDSERHYQISLVSRNKGITVIHGDSRCDDYECLSAELVRIDDLPVKVQDSLLDQVPPNCIAVETPLLGNEKIRIYNGGASISRGKLRNSPLLYPGDSLEYDEKDQNGNKVTTLIYNHSGRAILESGYQDKQKRALIRKRLELLENTDLTYQQIRKITHVAKHPENVDAAMVWLDKSITVELDRVSTTGRSLAVVVDRLDVFLKGRGGDADFKIDRMNKVFEDEGLPTLDGVSYEDFDATLAAAHKLLLARY